MYVDILMHRLSSSKYKHTSGGGHVSPAGHQAVLVRHGAAWGQRHRLDVAVERGGAAEFDEHDVVVQGVAVVPRVLDHLGRVHPLLRALVNGEVVLAKAHLDATGGRRNRMNGGDISKNWYW